MEDIKKILIEEKIVYKVKSTFIDLLLPHLLLKLDQLKAHQI